MSDRSNPEWSAERRGHWSYWALAMAWVLFVFGWYSHVTHIGRYLPFVGRVFNAPDPHALNGGQTLQIWGESLRILLTVAWVTGSAFALGRRVRAWLGLELPDPWVRSGFNFGFGILSFNLFWVGTGLLRLWYGPLWWAGIILCSIYLVLDLIQLIRARVLGSIWKDVPREPAYLLLLLAGCSYFLFSILVDLAPETFYDSMVYHLAVPSYWLMHHGFRDFPTNFFSNYPFGAECYFLSGLVLQGTESAKMLHAVAFGVCALLAGGWAREITNEKRAGADLGLRPSPQHSQVSPLGLRASGQAPGWLTMGLTLTLPLFVVNSWATQVEGFLAFVVLLFVYSASRFVTLEQDRASWALAAGLFAGYAFSTKYTAFLVAGAILIICGFRDPGIFKRKYWGQWAVLLFGVLILLGPWILKNLAYTGNPFFPYFMSFFRGRHLPQAGYAQLLAEQQSRVTNHWWEWLLLPWTLTMSTPNSYNFCGPLALAFIPFCFLFRIQRPVLRMLVWLTSFLLVMGLAVTHILRFIVPDFVLLYVLLGALLAGGDKPVWGKIAAWMGSLCALICFVNLAAMVAFYYPCAGIWMGKETRADYLSSGRGEITPYYAMAQWIGRDLPPDAGLLVVGDARGLYYERPFLTNSVFDEQTLTQIARKADDAEGVARALKEMGVNYLVINGQEGMRVSSQYDHYDLKPEEWARLDEFMQRGTEVVYDQNLQEVHRILPAFQAWPKKDSPDLLLFFSKLGTQYVRDAQSRKAEEALKDLDEISKLYPFSRFWKQQRLDFEKAVKDPQK